LLMFKMFMMNRAILSFQTLLWHDATS
jgi:hypothetical protein